ncbi:hypothetical protein [Glycomyces algeriensis]|uniref:WXG100 family type VII secretion target n=1 Tax=Glycomyces algeriensis TaxID=256037 RepID=A0A9W6G7U0_9ACTN|nr:hypothetical protein [Glycomyces algeriensis]MDA1366021.1 hypothetical protein [Glycomyces algeriensis]MDR7349212.1 hypothetical protein [Glycomyces algeriensis]GLI41912.1 hypothetical protein GALLR39Z86_17620 [Glycomyces algeriensis]
MADDSDITNDEMPGDTTAEKVGNSIPGVKQFLNSKKVIEDAIESDEVTFSNAAATVGADIASLGLEAFGAFKNPLGMLVNVGLDFVLNLFEPANKLLTWLSGDPDAMGDLQERWRQCKDALVVLREEVDTAWESALATSVSPTTDAAKDKVSGMAAAIAGVASAISQVESHIGMAQMLAKAIYELIKALLSALVEQCIIYGLIALASSWASAGGSIMTFLMWATRQTAVDTAAMCLRVSIAQFTGSQLAHIGGEVLRSTFLQSSAEMLQWAGGVVSNWAGGIQGTGVPGKGLPGPASKNPSAGMAAYIDVDPEEFKVGATELSRLKTNADSLSAAVNNDTETDFMTWGLACQGWVEGYNEQRVQLSEDVALISPALEGNAQRFNEVAAAYEDADIQASEDIKVAGGK